MPASQVAMFVEKRVALYQEQQEAWKADHRMAMACFEVEELLVEGLQIYDSIHRFDANWKLEVFREICEYDPNVDEQIRGLFGRGWPSRTRT